MERSTLSRPTLTSQVGSCSGQKQGHISSQPQQTPPIRQGDSMLKLHQSAEPLHCPQPQQHVNSGAQQQWQPQITMSHSKQWQPQITPSSCLDQQSPQLSAFQADHVDRQHSRLSCQPCLGEAGTPPHSRATPDSVLKSVTQQRSTCKQHHQQSSDPPSAETLAAADTTTTFPAEQTQPSHNLPWPPQCCRSGVVSLQDNFLEQERLRLGQLQQVQNCNIRGQPKAPQQGRDLPYCQKRSTADQYHIHYDMRKRSTSMLHSPNMQTVALGGKLPNTDAGKGDKMERIRGPLSGKDSNRRGYSLCKGQHDIISGGRGSESLAGALFQTHTLVGH